MSRPLHVVGVNGLGMTALNITNVDWLAQGKPRSILGTVRLDQQPRWIHRCHSSVVESRIASRRAADFQVPDFQTSIRC